MSGRMKLIFIDVWYDLKEVANRFMNLNHHTPIGRFYSIKTVERLWGIIRLVASWISFARSVIYHYNDCSCPGAKLAPNHQQPQCWRVCGCYVTWINAIYHDDVIKWKHFPRYWPFLRGIHRSLVNSPHKGQWRGALMFSLICAWINGCVNNREAGDLRRHRAHYDVTVMTYHGVAAT